MIQMTTPILPSHHDSELARMLSAKLEQGTNVLLGDLPKPVLVLVRQILEYMAEGHAVSLLVLPNELSTQEVATVLGVSRPFVVKLMNQGVLAYRKVGTHRRVMLSEVLRYLEGTRSERLVGLSELTANTQTLALSNSTDP
jgi:excisionase family DNA binding protein